MTVKKTIKAFTLVELLVASSIYALVIVGIYAAFHSGVFGYAKINQSVRRHQTAARILERIGLDLRNAFIFSDKETRFTGTSREVRCLTLTDTYVEGDVFPQYALVSYRFSEGSLMRQCLRGKESLLLGTGTEPQEMSAGIKEFSFQYGHRQPPEQVFVWENAWTYSDILPEAVKIKMTIGDDRGKGQESFERTVFLVAQG